MSAQVLIYPASAVDVTARRYDVLVMRNELNDISVLLINTDSVNTYRPADGAVFRYVYRRRDLDDYTVESGDRRFHVLALVSDSGHVECLYDGRLRTALRWNAFDRNRPRIVTVHTFENAIVAIDDMPVDVEPIVVRSATCGAADELAALLRAASPSHLIIVTDEDVNMRVLDVLIHTGDGHVSVPFTQRWPMVLTAETTVMDYRQWLRQRDGWFPVASPFTVSTDPPTTPDRIMVHYNPLQITRWHAHQEAFGTLVYHPDAQKLEFVGTRRKYPLSHEEMSWLYLDTLRADCPSGAPRAPNGAITTQMMARNSAEKLRPLLDEASIVDDLYV